MTQFLVAAVVIATVATSAGPVGASPLGRAQAVVGYATPAVPSVGHALPAGAPVVPQISAPLASLAPVAATAPGPAVPTGTGAGSTATSSGPATTANGVTTFLGLGDEGTTVPSDSDLAVGPTAAFEIAEPDFQIFSLDGTPLTSPAKVNTLWDPNCSPTSTTTTTTAPCTGVGPCAELSTGDWSQIIYDQLAGQFVYARSVHILGGPVAEAYECLAVSETDDPLGSWYLYTLPLMSSNEYQTDYPQLGWNADAYYLSVNLWTGPGGTGSFTGDLLVAYNRADLLAGLTLTPVEYQLSNAYESFTPTSLEGQAPEPPSAPELFVGGPSDLLLAYQGGKSSDLITFAATPDWATGALDVEDPLGVDLNIGAYDLAVCPAWPNCAPQPGTSTELETWSDNLMLPLVYRNFGSYQSIVGTFDVKASSGVAAPEWFEIREYTDQPPELYQEGVYSPNGASRFDQSINEDDSGDIILAYSLSSSTIYPSIAGAAHLPSMPLGSMTAEHVVFSGGASQTSSSPGLNPDATPSRWGDASYLALAPNGCTAWYSNAFYPNTTSDWQTEIVSYTIPSCQ